MIVSSGIFVWFLAQSESNWAASSWLTSALFAKQFGGGCHVVGRQCVHRACQIYFVEDAEPVVFWMQIIFQS